MNDTPHPVDPALVTYLKRLVTMLAGTMTLGFLVIVVLFVIRFSGGGVQIPDELMLPEGTTVSAYTQGKGWVAVTTTDNRILIFDPKTGSLLKEIAIDLQ